MSRSAVQSPFQPCLRVIPPHSVRLPVLYMYNSLRLSPSEYEKHQHCAANYVILGNYCYSLHRTEGIRSCCIAF